MCLHWLALNLVNGLGPVRIGHLVDHFGTPEAVLSATPHLLKTETGLPDQVIIQLKSPDLMLSADSQYKAAVDAGVSVVTLVDPRYPPQLKEIYAPPPVLFIKGNPEVFQRHAIAVVGTRTPTLYGKTATTMLVSGLVEAQIAIVSGLAVGIDTCAHSTCVAKNGQTIAVLGCGIDRIYPSSNKSLAERITESGALVSEFPMGTAPETFNFPRRNRIISGLSAGVLVIEAGKKSGSLITAGYALQQNRDVFAVPGPITSDMSTGTFNLIRSGAIPVRIAAEIIESIQTIKLAVPVTRPARETAKFNELLPESEADVFSRISAEPVRVDQLIEALGTENPDLFNILLNLELKGIIRQLPGQMYVRT